MFFNFVSNVNYHSVNVKVTIHVLIPLTAIIPTKPRGCTIPNVPNEDGTSVARGMGRRINGIHFLI